MLSKDKINEYSKSLYERKSLRNGKGRMTKDISKDIKWTFILHFNEEDGKLYLKEKYYHKDNEEFGGLALINSAITEGFESRNELIEYLKDVLNFLES